MRPAAMEALSHSILTTLTTSETDPGTKGGGTSSTGSMGSEERAVAVVEACEIDSWDIGPAGEVAASVSASVSSSVSDSVLISRTATGAEGDFDATFPSSFLLFLLFLGGVPSWSVSVDPTVSLATSLVRASVHTFRDLSSNSARLCVDIAPRTNFASVTS